MIKKIFLFLVFALVVIQFIRPAENHSDKQSANDITLHYTVPDTVRAILQRSCYDCHSNNTVYPWYNKIQPVAWWLSSHIKDGKRELNFSEFASYPPAKQAKKLKNTVKEVKGEGMPLDSYLWIHKDAKLEQGQKDTLIQWANSLQQTILKAGPSLTERK
ncbi:MAG: cytochrome C [Sphingobacteriales bacterium 50-39]|nr:heme-binding domain-containing protein [Sphingobacteriales bacterium]OJW53041.1 MAG: cytochrome C [Sphingobacteriales bacterium 50-39]